MNVRKDKYTILEDLKPSKEEFKKALKEIEKLAED
jgi:hypothetical protein